MLQDRTSGGRRADGLFKSGSKERPLISVITATFNCHNSILLTAKSIRQQDYDNIEWIIIDGQSKDDTLDYVLACEDIVDYWVSEKDHGIYDAFNKGVVAAKGDWIIFLGAGDQLHDTTSLSKAASVLSNLPSETELAYGRVVSLDSQNRTIEEENKPWAEIAGRWKGGRPTMPHHQGIFHRRTLLMSDPFDIRYKIVADSKVFFISMNRQTPVYIDYLVGKVHLGGVSTTPGRALAAAVEIRGLNRELGLGFSEPLHQLWFMVKSVLKHILAIALPEAMTRRLIDTYRSASGRKKKWT